MTVIRLRSVRPDDLLWRRRTGYWRNIASPAVGCLLNLTSASSRSAFDSAIRAAASPAFQNGRAVQVCCAEDLV